MDVQKYVEKGASKEKVGLRGATPPGVLFAVYDSQTGNPDYIPPEYCDIPKLLDELVEYVNTTDNRLSVLVKNGFVEPLLVNRRIRSYELSDFTRDNEKKIKKIIA